MVKARSGAAVIVLMAVACLLALCVGCSSSSSSASSTSASASASSTASSSAAASSAAASSAVASSAAASSAASSAASAEVLADGEYSIGVTLSGGSGKASVTSPAKLVVSGGAMTATLVWSSPNYDQMIVDGVQYTPVNTSGNSTFEVPVKALGQDIAVQARTTAMSEPHLIDYTLRFDESPQK